MDKEQEKMQEGNEFLQVLRRFEEMVDRQASYFFDVEDFEDIIDYYLDVRNFKKAGEAADVADRQHPGSSEIRIKRVHIFLESGKPAQALDLLAFFPESDKQGADYYLLRGSALAQLGKVRDAERDFDLALSLSEEDQVDTLINISIAFENSKHYRQAVKYLKMAFDLENDNLTVLYDLGYYYERLHDFPSSINFYNKYLDIDPFSENVWYNLGVVFFKSNMMKEALEAYDFAIAINPGYGSAYFNKANIYANEKDYNKAISIYREFLGLEPGNIQAWCYLGECYEETEDYLQALDIYKKVIEIDNSFADGWLGAGICHLHRGNMNDALVYILKAIDLDRQNPEYWFTLGEAYEKAGMPIEAQKAYSEVTFLDREDREAWIRQAFLLIDRKDYPAALIVLREGYQHNFNSQDFVYLIAGVYFRTGDQASGMLYLEKALEMGEGALKLFFLVYPEGEEDKLIQSIIKKDRP